MNTRIEAMRNRCNDMPAEEAHCHFCGAQVYTVQKVSALLASFCSELSLVMLFLKSIEAVEIMEWPADAPRPRMRFSCQLKASLEYIEPPCSCTPCLLASLQRVCSESPSVSQPLFFSASDPFFSCERPQTCCFWVFFLLATRVFFSASDPWFFLLATCAFFSASDPWFFSASDPRHASALASISTFENGGQLPEGGASALHRA
jgi:hypothetical protein